MKQKKTNTILSDRTQSNLKRKKCFRNQGEDCLQSDTLVFLVFLLFLLAVSIFHEPWYDEAQAWLIAADASWKEILLSIPHYEGHPPLWHLILALSAKCGIGPDLGLRMSGLVFSGLSAWLIIRKAPFRKLIRYTIPFTYYLFYRYSVVVRPYCMTMAALVLAAVSYRKRKEHPLRFTLALLLLSMSNAFGMMLAAGICIVWLIEMVKEYRIKGSGFFRDRRLFLLAGLLVINIGQLLLMIPYSNTNSVRHFDIKTIVTSFIYLVVIGPADSMFLDVGMDARLQDYAGSILFGDGKSVINLVIGLITLAAIWYVVSKFKKRLLLIIPYLLFAAFGASVYFWYHHIGIIFLFLLFVFWCCYSDCPDYIVDSSLIARRQRNPKSSKALISEAKQLEKQKLKGQKYRQIRNPFFTFLLCLSIGVSLLWNLFACYTDFKHDTWDTKSLAEGIREIGADREDVNCMVMWHYYPVGPFEQMDDYRDVTKYGHNVSITNFFDCLIYFDKNIFYNHNQGNEMIRYNRQILNTPEEDQCLLQELAKKGYPEYIIGSDYLVDLLPIEGESPRYCKVYRVEVFKVDKFIIDYNDLFLYAREDVYRSRNEWPIVHQLQIK